MKSFSVSTLAILTAASFSATIAPAASAATVTFTGMPTAVYGQANETPVGDACPTSGSTACFQQDGVVVGVVKDPTDSGAHYHRSGTTADREAQYHPDSSGFYIRMADLSNFSLTSLNVNSINEAGGEFAIYGYSSALNPGLLTTDVASAPDWGSVTPVATYKFANDGSGVERTLDLATLGSGFANVGAIWIHLVGFPHSPTTNYLNAPPPDFDLRLDNITLSAPVPIPAGIWLLGSGVAALFGRRKLTASA